MVGHGEVHHACGALLLGQLQTGAAPALEHAGLGVLVCGGLELCTHGHSLQVGNSAAALQSDRCIGDIEFIGLGSVLGVLCFQRDVVCGHREGDGRLGGVHISRQTGHFPTGEGLTFHRLCSNSNVLFKVTLFVHAVHGQGVGVLLVLRFQRDIVCGHREADVCLGGIRTLRHALCLPITEGVAFFIGCDKVDVIACNVLFVHAVHGQGVGVLLVPRFQRNFVCRHLEGNSCLGGVRTLGHAIYLPTSEGATFLLGCSKSDFLIKVTLFVLPVHGQGVGDRLIDALQADVVCRHRELDLDMRAGIGDGIRILCQSFDLPCDGIAFPLVSAKGDLIAHVLLHAFLTIPVVLRLGRLRHNIGAYPIDYVLIIGVGVFNIVLTRRHLDVHIVAAGGGGNSFALVGAVQQGRLRVGIVVICASVFHRVLGGIVGKVLSLGRVADRFLTQLNRTGLVLSAFLCNDGSLIAAIRIGHLVDKGLAFVYTGKALKLDREFANTFHIGAGHRAAAVIVHVEFKVIQS